MCIDVHCGKVIGGMMSTVNSNMCIRCPLRNQNLWKRLAELYNSQPEQVYVSDSGIKNATGSISNDIYLSFLVDNTKKPRFVEYRCDVIVKEINNEGEIRVISSKLSTKMYSSKNRHGNDSVKFLPTRANADVSEVVLSEINEHPVLGKTRLVKRSVDRESNVTDLQTHVNGSKMTFNAIKSISGVKSLDEDYEQMSGKLTDMRSRLRRFKKNMNDSMNKRLLLDIEDKRNVKI
ncbi:hypothetical protein Btru_044529 [Bulinus truncatus]|nr:hypothetical protein Btru_044529 [Bulinus truncatus]